MKFHHIGIACHDIQEEIVRLNEIYNIKSISETCYDSNQQAWLCLINTDAHIQIELISGKKVVNMLKKGITYYHLCYEVKDIEKKINELLQKECILVSPPKEASLFNNRRVAFLYCSHGLIELLEMER